MEEAVLPLAFVALAVFPLVDAVARGLVFFIVAIECAPISIDPSAFAVSFAILKGAIILISIRPDQSALSMGHLRSNITLISETTIQDQCWPLFNLLVLILALAF